MNGRALNPEASSRRRRLTGADAAVYAGPGKAAEAGKDALDVKMSHHPS